MAALGGFASKMGLATGPVFAGYILAGENTYPLLIVVVSVVIAACLLLALHPLGVLDAEQSTSAEGLE